MTINAIERTNGDWEIVEDPEFINTGKEHILEEMDALVLGKFVGVDILCPVGSIVTLSGPIPEDQVDNVIQALENKGSVVNDWRALS